MAIVVLHTGQTGVERGVDRAAREAGFKVEGFSTRDARDEIGPIPGEIAGDLQRADRQGARVPLGPTLALANALVVVLPPSTTLAQNTGAAALVREARKLGVTVYVADPSSDFEKLCIALRALEHALGTLRVMVWGPRGTRWAGGEGAGWRFITTLAMSARKHRVLVVDDEEHAAQMTCTLLRAIGHEAEAAVTGEDALARASLFNPSIVLVDIRLPGIDGYEVFRQLAKRPLYSAAVTAWPDEEAALAAGFDRHVLKPTGEDVLRELVANADRRWAQSAAS